MNIKEAFKKGAFYKRIRDEKGNTVEEIQIFYEDFKNSKYSFEDINDIFLNNNKITKIPDWINECKKLRILDLSNNKIEKISNLDNCLDLRNLILKNNQIITIENLNEKPLLIYINLENNPLKYSEYNEEYFIKNNIEVSFNINENINVLNDNYIKLRKQIKKDISDFKEFKDKFKVLEDIDDIHFGF